MRLIFLLLIAMLAILTAGISSFFGYQYYQNQASAEDIAQLDEEQETPPALEIPPLIVYIVQTDGDVSRILKCAEQRCTPEPKPGELPNLALFDSEAWYHYDDTGRLVRTRDNQSDILIAPSRLVEPRELVLSPDSRRLAFWLDDVATHNAKLTELWMFDRDILATRLLAEGLNKEDIFTRPRWNHAGTQVFFVGNTAPQGEDQQLELLTVQAHPPKLSAGFKKVDWQELEDILEFGQADLSTDGFMLAIATPSGIRIVEKNSEQFQKTSGTVTHLQWLEDDSLLYAVQERDSFTIWRRRGKTSQLVTRQEGALRAAMSDQRGEFLVLVGQKTLYAIEIKTGLIEAIAVLPEFGASAKIARVQQESDNTKNISSGQFTDAEIVAFLDKHLVKITREPLAAASRITTTDRPNAVYVEYNIGTSENQRILMTIHDLINPDWSLLARYKPVSAEWQKTQGGGLPDPEIKRVYEWEGELTQWILKQEL